MTKPLTLERLAIYYTVDPERGCRENVFSSFFGGGDNYNNITSRVIVGCLPKRGVPSNIKMVVSVNTYAELAVCKVSDNIKHVVLHVPDATADVPADDALDVVLQMRDFLRENPEGEIYIHCHVGKGRSVMICATLLTLFPVEAGLTNTTFADAEEAFKYIRSKRHQALVEWDKVRLANEVVQLYKQQPVVSGETKSEPPAENAAAYLASLTGKDAIRRLQKFMDLVTFACGKQNQYSTAIQMLC